MLTRLSNALARNPGGRAAWAVAVVTLGLPAAVFGACATHSVWLADTFPVVPTAVQELRHGSRNLAPYLVPPRQGRWGAYAADEPFPYYVRPAADGTGAYSNYPAGMEVFAWPAVALVDAAGYDLDDDAVLLTLERATAAAAAGVCVALFFLAALRVGRPAAAWVTAALFATGSVVPSVLAQLLWQQTGVVACVLTVLLVELRGAGRVGRGGTAVQAMACALMLACRPSAVSFLVPFGVWVLVRDRRRGVVLPLAAVACYSPWAAMYWATYRTPFGPSMAFLGQTWTAAGNVLGVLFSPGRGVFVYQPWAWLVLLLLAKRVRTDPARPLPAGWYAFALAAVACHVVLVGSWGVWWGGYCWGSRLAAEVIPLLGLLAVRPVGFLIGRRWGWAVLAAVAAAGIALHAAYTYADGGVWNVERDIDRHPEYLWDWRHPPFLYPLEE